MGIHVCTTLWIGKGTKMDVNGCEWCAREIKVGFMCWLCLSMHKESPILAQGQSSKDL